MSIQAVAWALNQPVQDPAAKLVLISLCNAYNGDTATCRPSHARIAQEATVSIATVKRKLKYLCEEGWIEGTRSTDSTGRTTANSYRIFFDWGGGQNDLPGGQSYDLGEGVNCDLPLKKPEEEPEDIPLVIPPASAFDVLKPYLGEELARAVVEHRKKIRKGLTPFAAKLLLGKFEAHGDVKEAACAMIENGWQGFESAWLENRKGGKADRHFNQDVIEAFADLAQESRQ